MASHALRALARVVSLRHFSAGALGGAGIVAVAAAAASLGQGCSVGVLSAAGDDGSTGFGVDGGGSSGGGPSADAAACKPGDVRTYVPPAYTHATAPWQGACTGDQLAAAYAACIDPVTSSTAACRAFSDPDASTGPCGTCVLTPVSANAYGPFIDHGTFVTENASGCIELTDQGPGGLTCAKAQQALDGCELAACGAFCPAYDTASHAVLDTCMAAAATGGCLMFDEQASCTSAIAEAGRSAQCTGLDFHDFFIAVAPLFCGPPPAPDGSAPPADGSSIDGGSTDATTGNDGASPGDAAGESGYEQGEATSDAASSDGGVPEGSPAEGSASDSPSVADAGSDAPAD